jgi:glucose/mannose-6-phosphate isomerase
MRKLLCAFPEQAAQAWRLSIELPEFEKLVICGMGGSAIGGDYLRVYLINKGFAKPIFVIRGYELPLLIDEKTLVFTVSYSGNTEEALACFEQAFLQRCKLIALTSGGRLAKLAHENKIPLLTIPPGMPPRIAFMYLFLPLLKSLLPFLDHQEIAAEFEEALDILTGLAQLYSQAPEEQNSAKQLSRFWYNRIPSIYGIYKRTDVVAQRWKTQINENAKAPAYWNTFPELSHNEIMGWARHKDLLAYTLLRDPQEPLALRRRFELSREILVEQGCLVHEVQGLGNGFLAQLLSLSYLGDWSSFYLAMLYGVDPTPVPAIERMKKKLIES